jgi:uncharacterized protein YqhQ
MMQKGFGYIMAKKDKNNSCQKQRICSIGCEALLEGIMMRAPEGYAQVVRTPTGELDIKKKKQPAMGADNWFLKLPMVRGSIRMLDSLIVGTKALFNSAEISATEDDPAYTPTKFDLFIEKHLGEKAMAFFMGISLVLAVLLSVTLFFLLPNLISEFIDHFITLPKIIYSLVEGVVRIAIFLAYMYAVSHMKDIKRLFMYHGAEHKTIHCYENFDELTVENVRKHSKHHPRCGTAFLFVVMIISILIHALLPKFDFFLWNLLLRLATLPIIAGIAYEFNRFAGRHENGFVKILRAPGMAMQRFTTKEPTDDMIEVAIIALKEALSLGEMPDYSAKDPVCSCESETATEDTSDSEEKKQRKN